MTNAEKYQKSIRKIINEGSLAVHKVTGEPYNCDATEGRDDCLISDALHHLFLQETKWSNIRLVVYHFSNMDSTSYY